MKKYFVTVAALAIIAACNSNSGSNSSNADSSASGSSSSSTNDVTSNPDYQKGLALIAANDCLTCHKVDEKVTGPAYDSVANRYAYTDDNIKMLAHKVITGGAGNWGNVPMTPHPALSEADAEQMVKYVLLLRTK